jgi:hypothetical protein
MKVYLDAPLFDRKGEQILEGGNPIVLRHALFMTLDTPIPDDTQALSTTKLRLAQLGIKIAGAGSHLEMTSADTMLMLERAAKLTSTLIFGQMVAHLDPGQLAPVN